MEAANASVVSSADPDTYFEKNIFPMDPWVSFTKLRTAAWHRKDCYKAYRKKYDAKRYESDLKAKRSTPEARTKLNAQRRARYARKKAESSSVPDIMGTI